MIDRSSPPLFALFALSLALLSCGEAGDDALVTGFRWATLPPDGARQPTPRSLTIGPQGEVVALDTGGRVLILDPATGEMRRFWRMPDNVVGNPEGVIWLQDGRIAVCDTHYHRVALFDAQGTLVDSWGSRGTGPGQYEYPVAIAQDPSGHVYVAEYGGNDRVQKLTADGRHLVTIGRLGTGEGELQRPSGMAWHDGVLYVADAINNRVLAYAADDGRYLRELGGGSIEWRFPYDIELGPEGDLWVIEYGACRLTRVSVDGELRGRWGQPGIGQGQLRTPWALTVDAERVYIADTGNRRLVLLDR